MRKNDAQLVETVDMDAKDRSLYALPSSSRPSALGASVIDVSVEPATWNGVLQDRSDFSPDYLLSADRLADAAKLGDWPGVFAALDDAQVFAPEVNRWRPGGASWFTPLHQAAWLDAPSDVVAELLRRGAWTSITDSRGRRPVDLARERGHRGLLGILEPSFDEGGSPGDDSLAAMNRHLETLIGEIARPALEQTRFQVRYPDVTFLFEDAGPDELWFPIPGMAGGFLIEAHNRRVHVESWCRVVEGSGLYHVVTRERTILVEEGFV